MFVMGMDRVIRVVSSDFSMAIIRGPWSFGFFSSIKAGRNMRRISVGVVAMLMNLKARIKHNTIASTNSAATKQLILNSIRLIHFPSHRAMCIEVNSRS